MKTRLIAGLIVALMLVVTMAVPAMAAVEVGKGATVTVNEYISFTVTDPGDSGLNWGDLDPGETDQPEVAQISSGAVTLTVAAETNVGCDIEVKGTDFTGAGTIDISNAKWDTDSDVSGATAMTTDYVTITTSTALALTEQDVWHWLSIPSAQEAGSYSSTFYYQAVKTS